MKQAIDIVNILRWKPTQDGSTECNSGWSLCPKPWIFSLLNKTIFQNWLNTLYNDHGLWDISLQIPQLDNLVPLWLVFVFQFVAGTTRNYFTVSHLFPICIHMGLIFAGKWGKAKIMRQIQNVLSTNIYAVFTQSNWSVNIIIHER